jgi:hypothetical protein
MSKAKLYLWLYPTTRTMILHYSYIYSLYEGCTNPVLLAAAANKL